MIDVFLLFKETKRNPSCKVGLAVTQLYVNRKVYFLTVDMERAQKTSSLNFLLRLNADGLISSVESFHS